MPKHLQLLWVCSWNLNSQEEEIYLQKLILVMSSVLKIKKSCDKLKSYLCSYWFWRVTTQIGFLSSLDYKAINFGLLFFFTNICSSILKESTWKYLNSHWKCLFFFYLLLVGPEKPRTLTPEWEADSIKKAKRLRANPITGISSSP